MLDFVAWTLACRPNLITFYGSPGNFFDTDKMLTKIQRITYIIHMKLNNRHLPIAEITNEMDLAFILPGFGALA
jgi:hypothetical protein